MGGLGQLTLVLQVSAMAVRQRWMEIRATVLLRSVAEGSGACDTSVMRRHARLGYVLDPLKALC